MVTNFLQAVYIRLTRYKPLKANFTISAEEVRASAVTLIVTDRWRRVEAGRVVLAEVIGALVQAWYKDKVNR